MEQTGKFLGRNGASVRLVGDGTKVKMRLDMSLALPCDRIFRKPLMDGFKRRQPARWANRLRG